MSTLHKISSMVLLTLVFGTATTSAVQLPQSEVAGLPISPGIEEQLPTLPLTMAISVSGPREAAREDVFRRMREAARR
jgi:hypothetical protein